MPAYISALDDRYISVQSAAKLIAAERPELSLDALLDMFVHGIFSKEFEPPVSSPLRRDDENWMHIRIERPLQGAATRALPIEKQPHDLYAVGAASVIRFLDSRRALPWHSAPHGVQTEPRYGDYSDAAASAEALATLVATSFSAFPEAGRAILGDILMSRALLRRWMHACGHRLPKFLVDGEYSPGIPPSEEDGGFDGPETAPDDGQSGRAAHADAERGRPPKAAWDRVIRIARDLHTKHPTMKRSALAFEANREALKEFDESEVPSRSTIERHMKIIIGPET